MKKRYWVGSVFFAYLLLVSAFFLVYIDSGFWQGNFESNAYEKLGVEETSNLYHSILDFYNEPVFFVDYSKLAGFTYSEQKHLGDVKVVFDWMKILFLISVIACFYYRKNVVEVLLYGGSLALSFICVLGIGTVISFEAMFTYFHKALFSAGTWAFPYDSLLITLFPQSFFAEFLVRIIIIAVILSFASVFLAVKLRKK